jgi:hypothetical protein
MKLNKGLFRDMSLEEQPNNTWVGGKNLVLSNKYNEIHNEPGFSKIIDESGDAVIIGIIPTSSEFVIFKYYNEGTNYPNEIGIYRNNAYIKILQADLNFNLNYPIFGEYYYNYNNELIVVWSDNYNKPRICNLDNLPFIVTANNDIIDPNDTHHLDLFSSFKTPVYTLEDVVESGGSLNAGIYYISLQYELNDGSYGNFLTVSNPITIYKDTSGLNFYSIAGCDDNESTSKAIKIRVGNLDNRYTKFRFGIIYKTKSSIQCYTTGSYAINSYVNTFYIPSLLGLSSINLSDIIVRNTYYDKIGCMTSIDNVLWVANVQITPELKYQKYANNIQVKYVYETQVALDGFKGSHKDPVMLFDRKSFMPGEVYALYIRFRYRGSNKVTQAFHIPGRDITGEELTPGDTMAKSISSDALRFHMDDTCNANGVMSYWHNINERYPEDTEFDGRFDYDGQPIVGGRNLKQTQIKHHKFPTSRYLNNEFGLIQPVNNDLINYTSLTSPINFNINPSYHKRIGFNSYSFNTSYISNQGTVFTNNTNSPLSIAVTIGVNGYVNFVNTYYDPDQGVVVEPILGSIKCQVLHSSGSNLTSGIVYDQLGVLVPNETYEGIGTIPYFFTSTFSVVLQPNEFISFQIDGIASLSSGITTINVNDNSLILLNLLNLVNDQYAGLVTGKILGIKLENVFIPEYIANECDSFEVLYAKRDNNNQTVLSQGMLSTRLDTSIQTLNRFYEFDLTSLTKSFKATHIQADGYIPFKKITNGSEVITPYTHANKYAKIINSQYLLNDAKYEIVDNLHREGSIYLDLGIEYINYPTQTSEEFEGITIRGIKNNILGTLCTFKPDMYLGFTNQELINTGKLYPIINSGINQSAVVYGGDVTYSLLGTTRYFRYSGTEESYESNEIAIVYNMFPIYSVLNPGLRYKGKQINELFYPAFNFINNKVGIGTSTIGNLFWQAGSYWEMLHAKYEYLHIVQVPEYYSNNLLYTSSNDIEPTLIYNYKNKFNSKFPFRLHKSLKQFEEVKVINWRTFKPAEYYESVSNRGHIHQLSTDGNDLLILHKYSLFVVRNITSLNINENIVASLGNSELFGTKPIEIMYNGVGYVGCQSKFATLKFKYGVLIIDRQSKKIFIYSNLKVDEITVYGLYDSLQDIIQYDDELLDEYVYYFDDGNIVQFDDETPVEYRVATLQEKLDIDNPFTQFGIHATWDEEYSRILITQVHADSATLDNNSFTLSYYPEIKVWGFFHDYIPKYSFYNRNGHFLINDNADIYKGGNTNLRTKYFNNYESIYIDVVFNTPLHMDKLFQSLQWATTLLVNNKERKDLTFDKIIIFNATRYSNILNIISDTTNANFNTRNTAGVWRFNELRDVLLNKDVEVININNINLLNSIDNENLATNWYDKNLMIDKYIVVRLSLNTLDLLDLVTEAPDPEQPQVNSGDPIIVAVAHFKLYDITASSNIIKR